MQNVFGVLLSLFISIMTSSSSLRQRLLNGGKSYGPLLLSDSPVLAELLATVGYSHIVVDHEHAPTDIRSGQAMLQAIDAANSNRTKPRTEPMVRVPAHDAVYMKKVLDGLRLPGGVLVPMVDSAATAHEIVRSTRYPLGDRTASSLDGYRGCAAPFVRGSSWGLSSPRDYMQETREDLLVMVQVETPEAIQAIPEIAQVEGVDGIFVGPLDLSASVGKMGQFDEKEVQALIASAEEAVRKSPVFLAGFRAPDRDISDMFAAGYQFVCGSADLGLIREAAKADLKAASKFLS